MNSADEMTVAFKSHLGVRAIPAEAVCLISERGVTALSGSSVERLAPLLDGTRTIAQVRRELAADLSAEEVDCLLGQLTGAGIIKTFPVREDHRHRLPTAAGDDGGLLARGDEAVAFWDLAGLDSYGVCSALASSAVEVIVTGRAERGPVAAACQASGLTVDDGEPADASLSLVVCDDYLDPALARINADHLASRRPWLLAKPAGAVIWIGPVFQPGAGPCWTCLAKRLAGNRLGEFIARRAAATGDCTIPPSVALPASRVTGLQLAVLEAVKWLAGFRHEGQQVINTLDTLTLRGESHRVTRRPQCPVCGDPGLVAAAVRRPVNLAARAIAAPDGNGQRALGLSEVLSRYGHLVDPLTGIVPELRRHPGSPDFVHTYLSGRNRAMADSSIAMLRSGLRSHSGGKGTTELGARVGALCEAVERYSATRDGDEPVVRDSYRGLGGQAVHPDACQLFHQRQYAQRNRWNAECAPFHLVPEPFDESAVTEWTPVRSMLCGAQRLLPTALLYFNPDPARRPVSVRADSNGNAAGASFEDAILHGFFELIERDAVALWWYNRTRQPEVAIDSFGDPWLTGLREQYCRINRQVWVLDVTSDLGVPVMAAISRRTDKPAEDIMVGFGAHFDPRIALSRALTELGQMLAVVVGARPDGSGYGVTDPHLLSWWTRATTRSEPYLLPDPSQPPQVEASYAYSPPQRLDLDRMCATARRAGLDILVLDQTRPDIGMPVVKVIVPGLRHFWPRFAPGRLFDVPVRLGRLEEKTPYDALNPIPIYL